MMPGRMAPLLSDVIVIVAMVTWRHADVNYSVVVRCNRSSIHNKLDFVLLPWHLVSVHREADTTTKFSDPCTVSACPGNSTSQQPISVTLFSAITIRYPVVKVAWDAGGTPSPHLKYMVKCVPPRQVSQRTHGDGNGNAWHNAKVIINNWSWMLN